MNSRLTLLLKPFTLLILLIFSQNAFAQDIINSISPTTGNFIVKDSGPSGSTIMDASDYGVTNYINNALGTFSVWGAYGTHMMEITSTDIINTVPTSFKIEKPGADTSLMILSGTSFQLSNGSSVFFDATGLKFSFGLSNTITGGNAFGIGRDLTSSGLYSMAFGDGSTANGKNSIVMGKGSTASGERSIAIGNSVEASGIGSIALGNNVSTDSKTGAFIFGDGTSTLVNSTANHQMTMRFSGGYNLYTNVFSTVGVSLAANGTSWSFISDSTKKENFRYSDGEYFLNSISEIPLGSWNYKNQDPKEYRHYGPMAQDIFHYFGKDQFGTIGNDTTLATADMIGITMICLQALEKRTSDLKKENEQLRTELNDLKEIKEELAEFRNLKAELNEQIKILEASNESGNTNVGFLDN